MRMHVPRILLALCASCFAVVALMAASASAAVPSPSPTPDQISAAERASLDTAAARDIAELKSVVPFAARFPTSLPSGYAYDRVTWDSGNPSLGFSIWLIGPDSTARDLHILEAPAVDNAPKDTLREPGLIPRTLGGNVWQTIQKPDEPWKGLFIAAAVQSGVHIEVDGPSDAVLALAAQL